MNKLSALEIDKLVKAHGLWCLEDGGKAMVREIVLEDFKAAFGLMAEIALMAESLNHHPEWSNVYNRLRIRMTTHDADGLTSLDQSMISFIDERLKSRGAA
jgi:4a-hydroxytetrahydrobiopterin dehydratase